MIIHKPNKDGKDTYTGGPGMKASQHYPRCFGAALAQVFESHRSELAQQADAMRAEVEQAVRAGASASQHVRDP
eukprot:12764143-Alexandrium_andersonii.AAC.1